MEYQLFATSCK